MKQETARTLLHSKGLKATPARIEIIQKLSKTGSPESPTSILKMIGRAHDQATVYRTIQSLKKADIIKPIDLRHNHAHYELSDKKDHHHIVCRSCGRIEDIEYCNLKNFEKHILNKLRHFDKIEEHSLEFYGLCKRCVNKKH